MTKTKKKKINKKTVKKKSTGVKAKKVSKKKAKKSIKAKAKKVTKVKVKRKLANKKVAKMKTKTKKKKVATVKRKTKSKKIIKKISRKSKQVSKKRVKKFKTKVKIAPKAKASKEYKEIEQMLMKQRAEILNLISKSFSREKDISKLEHGNLEDMAATSLEREMTFAMGSRERQEFFMIHKAMQKIAIGTYGKCENCEKKILIKRLKIVPFAQYCMECKSAMEYEMGKEEL